MIDYITELDAQLREREAANKSDSVLAYSTSFEPLLPAIYVLCHASSDADAHRQTARISYIRYFDGALAR